VIQNNKPSLFILNNLLNVLTAQEGWDTLRAVWSKLRPDDYLIISGVVPEQLKKHKFQEQSQLDGIIEFHDSKGFYRSALSSKFEEYININLLGSSVVVEEEFTFKIKANQDLLIDLQGRRLLAIQKGAV
jgi:predicted SAM-dependent methyltransferase